MRFERRERSRAGHARRRTRAAYAGLVALSAAVLPGCSGSSEPAESPYESGRIGVDGVLAMAHLGAGFVDAWLGLPPGVAADVWILDEDVYGGPVAAVFRGAAPDEILASLIGGGWLEAVPDEPDRFRLARSADPMGLMGQAGFGPVRLARRLESGGLGALRRSERGDALQLAPTVDLRDTLFELSEAVRRDLGEGTRFAAAIDGEEAARFYRRSILPRFTAFGALAEMMAEARRGDAAMSRTIELVNALARLMVDPLSEVVGLVVRPVADADDRWSARVWLSDAGVDGVRRLLPRSVPQTPTPPGPHAADPAATAATEGIAIDLNLDPLALAAMLRAGVARHEEERGFDPIPVEDWAETLEELGARFDGRVRLGRSHLAAAQADGPPATGSDGDVDAGSGDGADPDAVDGPGRPADVAGTFLRAGRVALGLRDGVDPADAAARLEAALRSRLGDDAMTLPPPALGSSGWLVWAGGAPEAGHGARAPEAPRPDDPPTLLRVRAEDLRISIGLEGRELRVELEGASAGDGS